MFFVLRPDADVQNGAIVRCKCSTASQLETFPLQKSSVRKMYERVAFGMADSLPLAYFGNERFTCAMLCLIQNENRPLRLPSTDLCVFRVKFNLTQYAKRSYFVFVDATSSLDVSVPILYITIFSVEFRGVIL